MPSRDPRANQRESEDVPSLVERSQGLLCQAQVHQTHDQADLRRPYFGHICVERAVLVEPTSHLQRSNECLRRSADGRLHCQRLLRELEGP